MVETDEADEAISGMGQEAASRYMKAKLRVLQEELEAALRENQHKEARITELTKQVKKLEGSSAKLETVEKGLQAQVDKHKKLADAATLKAAESDKKLLALRKEYDTLNRNHKQTDQEGQSKDVRLNRALEEVERLKQQLKDAKLVNRDTNDNSRRNMDQLVADNKRLEKQKNELLGAFKKQLKLINVLRQQKMHVEAARLLAFTEEEFTKTLALEDGR